jgi:hypothetical protein
MNSFILETKNDLSGRLEGAIKNIDSIISSKLSEVSYWKCASDIYYSHLPYYHELNDFKKGIIKKNITEYERHNKKHLHSFGFNELDQNIIMQFPQADNDVRFGIRTDLYTINPNKSISSYITIWYPEKNLPTRLIALHEYKPIDNNNWIHVALNKNNKNWSATHYIYECYPKLEKAIDYIYYAGDIITDTYNFIYDDLENLDKIMINGRVHWKNKKLK